jgi:hypothetical protein
LTEQTTDPVLPFRLGDRRYKIKPNEITANLTRECRAETGYSPMQLFSMLDPRMDLDVVAALIWLARRQGGEPALLRRGRVTVRLLTDVEEGLTYDSLNDLELEEETEETPDPQS